MYHNIIFCFVLFDNPKNNPHFKIVQADKKIGRISITRFRKKPTTKNFNFITYIFLTLIKNLS